MPLLFKSRAVRIAGLLLVVVPLLWAGQQWRVFERGWFAVQEWRHAAEWREHSLWLPDYQVVIEAQGAHTSLEYCITARSSPARAALEAVSIASVRDDPRRPTTA